MGPRELKQTKLNSFFLESSEREGTTTREYDQPQDADAHNAEDVNTPAQASGPSFKMSMESMDALTAHLEYEFMCEIPKFRGVRNQSDKEQRVQRVQRVQRADKKAPPKKVHDPSLELGFTEEEMDAEIARAEDEFMCKIEDPPKRKTTTKKQKRKAGPTKADRILEQIEYYMSDTNLQRDDYYRNVISSAKDGWFSIKHHIMGAPRIQGMKCTLQQVVRALEPSVRIETEERNGVWLMRRANNKKLPSYRRYNRYDDDESGYGFGRGILGFTGSQCDDLLDYGVKPWDDDAWNILHALGGY